MAQEEPPKPENKGEIPKEDFAKTARVSAEEMERFRVMQRELEEKRKQELSDEKLVPVPEIKSQKTEEEITQEIGNLKTIKDLIEYIHDIGEIPSRSGEPHSGKVISGQMIEAVDVLEKADENDGVAFEPGFAMYYSSLMPSRYGIRQKWNELFKALVEDRKKSRAVPEKEVGVKVDLEKRIEECESIPEFKKLLLEKDYFYHEVNGKVDSPKIVEWVNIALSVTLSLNHEDTEAILTVLIKYVPPEMGVRQTFRKLFKIPY